MKQLILIMSGFFFFLSGTYAQHITDETTKIYYDEANTKLKESYAYKEVNVFSHTGDNSIVDVRQVKHGPYFFYYESGKLKISGSYKDDKKDKEWKYYDEQGNLIKTEVYKNGELVR
jgi:antitoxin component YwqK of YwqJK toxin-antitoxin module